MTDQERELFEKALAKWGQKNQLDQVDEEMNELALQLHRIRRKRNTGLSELASEVADVSIMLDQVRVCFGPDFENEVEAEREFKVRRLSERVADINHKGD